MELADCEVQLGLFAEGVAGCYYHLKGASEFHSRHLELAPDTAMLTADTLYLPDNLDTADTRVYRMLILQQLAQREFGSFQFRAAQLRQLDPRLADSAGNVDHSRTSEFEQFFGCVELPTLLRRIFAAVEQARLRACLADRYPGSRRLLPGYLAYRYDAVAFEPIESLPQLLRAFDACTDGCEPASFIVADRTGLLADAMAQTHRHCTAGASVYDSATLSLTLYQHWLAAPFANPGSLPDDLLEESDAEAMDWLQREARLEDWDEALAEADQALKVQLLSAETVDAAAAEELRDGELRPDDVDINSLQNQRDTRKRRLDMERSAVRDALGADRPAARSFRYDEWDHMLHGYRRHWCRLFEERLLPDGTADPQALRKIIAQHVPGVLKQLEQIKPLGFQRTYRVAEGDELDFNALIQARQDIRAGTSPDERVYSRKDRVHRDVCAAFLVDLSASTDDPAEADDPGAGVPDATQPTPPVNLRDPYDDDIAELNHASDFADTRRRIIDVQREAMLIMSAALEKLGDSYGVYGFSGYTRDCVEFFVAKEPTEAFTQRTLEAIASMSPKRSTRMGPAIRHATAKLQASGNSLKLLVILSDGFPQDADYGPERGDHEYGLQDTARALQEAHSKGVESFCVTVDKSGHDYLKRMCPDARYMIIDEIEDLPQALSKVYNSLARR